MGCQPPDDKVIWGNLYYLLRRIVRKVVCYKSGKNRASMDTVALLLEIAKGTSPVLQKAQQMIGEDNLAILLASAALKDTSFPAPMWRKSLA